ncbi:Protein CBG26215 [Caenorhabditis briggsae]|uniref:Protein CBG26215 n=1 Tax=Caenorhabditis briggsae TaxID=6238 RepID=B6ILW0_CAEBR|nr:Protein CBG26215 [Caenorhabditis briggsae]CAS00890.1 Protein CBG26215 [Caenorhabditis briggsae]
MENIPNHTIYRPIPVYGVPPIGRTPQGMASTIVVIERHEASAFMPYCARTFPLHAPQVAASPKACSFGPLKFRTQKELHAYRLDRTAFFKTFAVLEPVDPMSPEYQDRLGRPRKTPLLLLSTKMIKSVHQKLCLLQSTPVSCTTPWMVSHSLPPSPPGQQSTPQTRYFYPVVQTLLWSLSITRWSLDKWTFQPNTKDSVIWSRFCVKWSNSQ